jgi:hypothetical protein
MYAGAEALRDAARQHASNCGETQSPCPHDLQVQSLGFPGQVLRQLNICAKGGNRHFGVVSVRSCAYERRCGKRTKDHTITDRDKR